MKRVVVPLDRDLSSHRGSLPAILVGPLGAEEIDPKKGVVGRDDIVYPIVIAILDSADQANKSKDDGETYWKWRQKLRRRFMHHSIPITGDPKVSTIVATVKPFPIVDQKAWTQQDLFVSALLVKPEFREPRDSANC